MKDRRTFLFGTLISVGAIGLMSLIKIFYPSSQDLSSQARLEQTDIVFGDPRPLQGAYIEYASEKGASRKLEDLKGQIVLVHFWATWCKPCKKELPVFNDFVKNSKIKTVCLLPGDDSLSRAQEILGEGSSLKISQDSHGQLSSFYGIDGVPTTILFGKDGHEIGRFIGDTDWSDKDLQKALGEL